jgi:hypothetical protein
MHVVNPEKFVIDHAFDEVEQAPTGNHSANQRPRRPRHISVLAC